MHIKQETLAGAQRRVLLLINNEIDIKLLSQGISSKGFIEKNMADDLTVFSITSKA